MLEYNSSIMFEIFFSLTIKTLSLIRPLISSREFLFTVIILLGLFVFSILYNYV